MFGVRVIRSQFGYEVSKLHRAAVPLKDGRTRFWLRSHGYGWLVFNLTCTQSASLRNFFIDNAPEKLDTGPTLFRDGSANRNTPHWHHKHSFRRTGFSSTRTETPMALKTITLGELKARLAWMKDLPDDTEITFGSGDLSFYRGKTRLYRSDDQTPAIVNIEFGELYQITHD